MMWSLEYFRKVENTDFNYFPVVTSEKNEYIFNNKHLLKRYISDYMSVELDENDNPIEPTQERVDKYNLFNNDEDKRSDILKFFKKNYERYLDIIKETNDFEIDEYKYDIIDKCDYYYLDIHFNRTNEKFIESYLKITKKQEDQNGV